MFHARVNMTFFCYNGLRVGLFSVADCKPFWNVQCFHPKRNYLEKSSAIWFPGSLQFEPPREEDYWTCEGQFVIPIFENCNVTTGLCTKLSLSSTILALLIKYAMQRFQNVFIKADKSFMISEHVDEEASADANECLVRNIHFRQKMLTTTALLDSALYSEYS